MKDLYHNVAVQLALNPQVSTTTKTSSAIDLQGFDAATVLVVLGATGDTLSGSIYWTLKLQHSDNDSLYEDVAVGLLLNGAATYVVDANSKDEAVFSFGYSGGRRYLKAVATPTGSHATGTPIGMLALKGLASIAPVA